MIDNGVHNLLMQSWALAGFKHLKYRLSYNLKCPTLAGPFDPAYLPPVKIILWKLETLNNEIPSTQHCTHDPIVCLSHQDSLPQAALQQHQEVGGLLPGGGAD